MKTLTCKIPEHLDAQLENAAREERVSKSEILRALLIDRLKTRRRQARPRAYDIVKDLCGSLRGPRDLSSNPKHMKGFGI